MRHRSGTDVAGEEVCPPTWPTITAMIGLSFMQGYFPASHKHAIVRPRLKKPSLDPLDLKSFRPISKLTERLVVDRFTNHARAYHLLPVKQSAYRQYHSTETAITIMDNDIVWAIAAGNISVLVLFDLIAAFDMVVHDVLLDVLTQAVWCCEQSVRLVQVILVWTYTVFLCRIGNIKPGESYM